MRQIHKEDIHKLDIKPKSTFKEVSPKMTKIKICEYITDNEILKPIRCRKHAYYGINGTYYCYEHKRIMEIVHIEQNRRYA